MAAVPYAVDAIKTVDGKANLAKLLKNFDGLSTLNMKGRVSLAAKDVNYQSQRSTTKVGIENQEGRLSKVDDHFSRT